MSAKIYNLDEYRRKKNAFSLDEEYARFNQLYRVQEMCWEEFLRKYKWFPDKDPA